MNLSRYVPLVARILTVILVIMTIVGYLLIFIPNNIIGPSRVAPVTRPEGVFDTY
ncbi:MAG: hypothetical protein WC753_00205 [Candidatus Gracilibacteria bacterium]